MELETLHVERRSTGRLAIQLQLSTNPDQLQENSRLLKNGGPAPTLEAIFACADNYVDRLRLNLNVGNEALDRLPENVTFRDCLKLHMTDSDVENALSRVLHPAKPSNAFIRKVLRAVQRHFHAQPGGDAP